MFSSAVHADGQYQASTFQNRLHELIHTGENSDPYFFLPWDASHWLDLAMIELREESEASGMLKRLIKRSNRFHAMFARGRGHVEYKGLAESLNFKARETVTFATTRFTSSAYDQWTKIYCSYKALITAYCQTRQEEDNENDETRYQIRGQDFAIDLCGILDILKPAIILMIKCQALSVAPWKIISWFPRVIDSIERIKQHLCDVRDGKIEAPSVDILPLLGKHWSELTEEPIEECTFQGMQVVEGWLVVGQTSCSGADQERRKAKRQVTYDWSARNPSDCVEELIVLCRELMHIAKRRYDSIIPSDIKKLAKVFEVEHLIAELSVFKIESNKLSVEPADKEIWEKGGAPQFDHFFKYVCRLPHVQELLNSNRLLDLMAHSSEIVFRRFKRTLVSIFWQGLGGVTHRMFLDEKDAPVTLFASEQLQELSVVEKMGLDRWFDLKFNSGATVTARLDEAFFWKALYTNADIFKSLGQEMSISIDVAMSGSGCEAIVEGFYSVVKNHKKSGRQSNEVLTHRAIVDWCIPHPISSPATMLEIARIFVDGNEQFGLPKHRVNVFTDERARAFSRFSISKVVDRIKVEEPRCPFIVKQELN